MLPEPVLLLRRLSIPSATGPAAMSAPHGSVQPPAEPSQQRGLPTAPPPPSPLLPLLALPY